MAETITVYIRKGAHDRERLFSFMRPDSIPTTEVMEKGLAIDGNQVLFAVTGYYNKDEDEWYYDHPFVASPNTGNLPEALLEAEKGLVAWLGESSYEVDFD